MKTLNIVFCIVIGFMVSMIIFSNLPTIKADIGDNFAVEGLRVDSTNKVIISSSMTVAGFTAVSGTSTFSGNQSITGDLTLDGLEVFTKGTLYNIRVGTTIVPTDTFMIIASTGGAGNAITLTSIPHISTASTVADGTHLYLTGRFTATVSSAVVFQDNDTLSGSNMELTNSATWIGANDILELIFIRDTTKWYEVGYSSK